MWGSLRKIAIENRRLQLVNIFKWKEDMVLLTYGIFFYICMETSTLLRRYTMNEVVSQGYTP